MMSGSKYKIILDVLGYLGIASSILIILFFFVDLKFGTNISNYFVWVYLTLLPFFVRMLFKICTKSSSREDFNWRSRACENWIKRRNKRAKELLEQGYSKKQIEEIIQKEFPPVNL